MFKVSEKVGSKYRYVVLCSQRTRQLLEGATPRIDTTYTKPAAIAMQEVLQEKIEWKKVDTQPPIVPETSETIEVEVGG